MAKIKHLYGELEAAWQGGAADRFANLIRSNIAELDPAGREGERSALWLAASIGSEESLRLLLKKGFAVSSKCPRTGWVPLYAATFWNHLEAVKVLLLEGRAAPDLADNYGQTSLMRAAIDGNLAIATTLLDYRAKVDIGDCDGRTALMLASSRKRTEIVRLLLGRKANPDLQDIQGVTALMKAGNSEICRLLLDFRADVWLGDHMGATVFDYMKHRPVILDLLERRRLGC